MLYPSSLSLLVVAVLPILLIPLLPLFLPLILPPLPASQAPGSAAMFSKISSSYDLANRIISLGGRDRSWRHRLAESPRLAKQQQGSCVGTAVDIATGTGDVAFVVADMCEDATVVGVDPSR